MQIIICILTYSILIYFYLLHLLYSLHISYMEPISQVSQLRKPLFLPIFHLPLMLSLITSSISCVSAGVIVENSSCDLILLSVCDFVYPKISSRCLKSKNSNSSQLHIIEIFMSTLIHNTVRWNTNMPL